MVPYPHRDQAQPVNRIPLSSIYQAAAGLDPLEQLPIGKDLELKEIYYPIIVAGNALGTLLEQSALSSHFRSSSELGQTLLGRLRYFQRRPLTEMINQYTIWQVKNDYSQYKVALLAELGIIPTYLVSQRSTFDTLTLLDKGHLLFPDSILNKVPEAVVDLAEAGKALAFDMPTACGFHIFRATESVLRKYYKHATGGRAEPRMRNISVYVNAMRQTNKGDEKILNALSQLSTLHRNPLIHPEVVLTSDEAIATIGLARSVVTSMLAEIPFEKLTTGTAPFAALGNGA